MQAKIQQKLKQIESEADIRFLLAVESGSRAWGFPSPDSDYDVRTLFIRPQSAYLSIDELKLTFEYIENQWFDVGGWDLRKALQLLVKSNAVLLEWFHSPVIYQQDGEFCQAIKPLLADYFQVNTVVHHYRGIAKNALSQLDFCQPIKLKKWLYVLRPLLAAVWAKEKKTIPPMNLFQLYQDLSPALRAEIDQLIEIKSTQPESYLHLLSPNLIALTYALYQQVEHFSEHETGKPRSTAPLNALFLTTLQRAV